LHTHPSGIVAAGAPWPETPGPSAQQSCEGVP
jgi:hypothetical protein